MSTPTKPGRCPICGTAMPAPRPDYPDYPFCTRRCRMVDLGRWLGEEYKVPGREAEDDRSTPDVDH